MKIARVLNGIGLALALPLGIAGPSLADTLVVGNKAEASVSLVDLGSKRVIATLPTGKGPHEVAVSPNGRLALIADYGGGPEEHGSTLTVIDLPTARVVKTIDLGEHRRPHGLVWLDGRRALVTAEMSKNLLEIDVEEGKVVRALPTNQDVSHMVAVVPGGARAFVANIQPGTVTALDLKTGKHLGNIKTGAGAEGIDVTPDGKQVWVTNRAADTVSVVDAKSLKVLATLKSPKFPIRVKITPDGKHALVSNAESGEISVFSVASRKLLRRISFKAEALAAAMAAVPSAAPGKGKAEKGDKRMFDFGESPVPIGILIAPDGKHAYVALANADKVASIDLKEWKVIGSVPTGKEPDGMGYSILDAGMAIRPVR